MNITDSLHSQDKTNFPLAEYLKISMHKEWFNKKCNLRINWDMYKADLYNYCLNVLIITLFLIYFSEIQDEVLTETNT